MVDLDYRRFKDTAEMHQHMAELQTLLQDMEIAASIEPLKHETGATFVGAAKCGECHKRAYAKWKESKHAHAYESLIKGRKGEEENWISRIYDPECLACHVTGWHPQEVLPYESGFRSAELTAHLVGQQCENCHGPAGGEGNHVALEEAWAADRNSVEQSALFEQRRVMHRDVKTAKQRLCIKCHDGDNSPKFNFEEYWKKIQHPWRD